MFAVCNQYFKTLEKYDAVDVAILSADMIIALEKKDEIDTEGKKKV